MLFWSVFLKTHKKIVINHRKCKKWLFWQSITFILYIFKNTNQKKICASIVFKAKSKPKHKENFCFGGEVSLKTKNALFGRSKMVLFRGQISNLYFCVCSCKRKLHSNFHQKYKYLGPLEFFENENFDVHAPPCTDNLDLNFPYHTWPLVSWPVLSSMFWPIKKKFHTPPYCTLVQCTLQ